MRVGELHGKIMEHIPKNYKPIFREMLRNYLSGRSSGYYDDDLKDKNLSDAIKFLDSEKDNLSDILKADLDDINDYLEDDDPWKFYKINEPGVIAGAVIGDIIGCIAGYCIYGFGDNIFLGGLSLAVGVISTIGLISHLITGAISATKEDRDYEMFMLPIGIASMSLMYLREMSMKDIKKTYEKKITKIGEKLGNILEKS